MPVETQWNNYTSGGVNLFTCDMSAARGAGSLTRLSIPTNTDARGDRGGGVYDKSMSIVSQQPVIRGATTAVESLLDVLTADGMCVCKADGPPVKPGAQFYGQARETCGEDGSKPADDAHTEYTVNWGHMRPETLSGSRGGDLELSFVCDGLTDASGANAPIIINEAASLPTGLDLGRFSLGSMIVSDIILTDIMDMRLDFNVALAEKLPALASIWPMSLATSRHTPMLTLTGRDTRRISPLATLTPTGRIAWLGTPAEKTNTQIRFRKRLSGDAFEDDDANVHFEMHMKGMAVVQQIFDATGASRANTVINVFGIEDDSGGENVPNPVQFAFQTKYSNFQPS